MNKPDNNIKRRAWRYEKPSLPPLSSLFKSQADRKRFVQEWLVKPWGYLGDFLGHFALKLLPIDTCSNLGALLGRLVVKTKYKKAVENMRRNLAVILPEVSEEEREAILTRNCENLGRLMTEYSVLSRICRDERRMEIEGFEAVLNASKNHPMIMVGLHLGNWEVFSSISTKFYTPCYTFYLPLNNPVERWLAKSIRKKLGMKLLPEGMSGVAPALKVLKRGGIVSILCDEGFAGELRAPLFGRDAHLKGNLALASRLARRTGAKLCIVHSVRKQAANFECRFSPVIELPSKHDARKESDMLDDVRFLNALIEPIIKNHLGQWYYLHDKL